MTAEEQIKMAQADCEMNQARKEFAVFWPEMEQFIRDNYRNWLKHPWCFLQLVCWKAFICGRMSKTKL